MKTKLSIVLIMLTIGLTFRNEGSYACYEPIHPTAILAGSPSMVFIGQNVYLDGTQSTAGSGSIVQWFWNYDYTEENSDTWTPGESTAIQSYTTVGTHKIVLRVVNSYGLWSNTGPPCEFNVTVKGIIYVNINLTTGNNNGFTWEDAFHNLQDALNVARSGVQIWVAQGTYYPTTVPTNRNASFVLNEGIAIYGGFAGNETVLDERDWVNNKTILSGDIDNDDSQGVPDGDNSLHVVKGANNAVLDGFVIIGGNANLTGSDSKGSGMLNTSASTIVRNSLFLGNRAVLGAGIYNDSAAAQITNCIFSGNTAQQDGAAIYNYQANSDIVGCTLSQNTASNGAGIYNYDCDPTVIGCIIYGNSGAAISNSAGSEPYISFSDVEGCIDNGSWIPAFGTNGGGNINAPPLFENADGDDDTVGTIDDDFHLQSGSPCIGTGVGGEAMGFNWPKDATTLNTATVTNPVDLVINSTGNVYVLNASATSPSQVVIYDSSLNPQGSPINVDATSPKGIALDGSGRIYIADTGGHRILRYKNDGGWLLDEEFDGDGIVGEFGSDDAQFNQPWGIALDWSGFVYVTDNGNDRVQVFDSTGFYLRKWGQPGSDDGQLDAPSGLCLLGTSNVFVAEAENHRIQNLSSYGTFFGKNGSQGSGAGQFNTPRDVSYDLHYYQIIVADTANNRLKILQLSSYGVFVDVEPILIKKIGGQNLSGPMGVACSSTDTQQIIYVADTGNNRVIRLEIQQDPPARTPLHIWESMKGALWVGDKNRALEFFADNSKDQYGQIFNLIETHLQDYVAGMGQMSLSYQTDDEVKYEMLHQNGNQTYSFPVFFIKNENGEWRILKF